ncbi:MAG: hypothetical protein ABIO79_04450 [Ferruginibacter sp.]
MQKNILFIYCCITAAIFFPSHLKAQAIENSINLYGTNFPQEKIHIHFDKEAYLPGETVWFKAYLFEENLPSERSTNFYAALYDEHGKLVQQQVSPIFGNSSDGHFTIPDNLQSIQLVCRAYTGWMLNFDTSMLFTRAIKIISNKSQVEVLAENKTVSLRFFPEAGDIIAGVVNTIAFKANYNNGLPFFVDGVIKKQQTGEVVMPLSVVHDGMGKFDLDFQPGDKYYAEWVDNQGSKQQTWLPDPKPVGVSLKLTIQKDKLYFNLVNRTGADSLHVLMYMYQKVFYKTNIKVSAAEPFTGMIPVTALPSGTMQLTVFDANWLPVAERIAFINNNNFSINAAINIKDISTQKRGKNSMEIVVADTIPANMSLSISDAEMNNEPTDNTIVSDLLLKGDIKGYIHNPAYYFTNNTDAALKAKLDLVMLTNGWRRYNWADMMVQKTPAIHTTPDVYLGVYGQIGKAALDKMEKNEPVNLIVKTRDSINSFYSVLSGASGIIKQDGLVFYDSARIYYTFNKSKLLNKQLTFSKYNFTLNQPPAINNYKNYLLPDTVGTISYQQTSLFNYYKNNNGINLFNDEKTMQGVVLKTGKGRNWQNDPLVKLDEKYATSMFSGGANSFSLDVLHDEKAWTKLDFYTYIRSMVPGLSIGTFNPASGRSLTYAGLPVLVYIDEHEMTTSDLESLSLEQIAYIKMIPNFSGRGADEGGRSINPAISVYTKKGDDLIDRRPKETDLNMVKVAGYSPIKEFYSPDYTQNNTTVSTDARTTLLWMPYMVTDKANRKVPISFYNNDFTKKMRIVLEGINAAGKMIRIEKIIE